MSNVMLASNIRMPAGPSSCSVAKQTAEVDRCEAKRPNTSILFGPSSPGQLPPPQPPVFQPPPTNPSMNREEAIKIMDPAMDSLAVGACTAIGSLGGPIGAVIGAGVGLAVAGLSQRFRRH